MLFLFLLFDLPTSVRSMISADDVNATAKKKTML